MNYVDGFVAAVPVANKDAYLRHAQAVAVVFKDCGALSVVENWQDDVPDGKLTSFPLAVQRKADEAVVFSWVTWPSRQKRDEGWAKLMADPRMQDNAPPVRRQTPDLRRLPDRHRRLIAM